MNSTRALLIWTVLVVVLGVPVAAAAVSPLLQWRQPVYIAAGFAGIFALGLLLLQPLLAGSLLPGVSVPRGRRVHRWTGAALVTAVILHVGGLWITSPPDVLDAFLFRSPTPFSAWGVIAMSAVFLNALLAALRRRLPLSPQTWRRVHTCLAVIVVTGGIVHALLIEGTMETVSKTVLCVLVAVATVKAIVDLKIWRQPHRKLRTTDRQ